MNQSKLRLIAFCLCTILACGQVTVLAGGFDTRSTGSETDTRHITLRFSPAWTIPVKTDGVNVKAGLGFDADISLPLSDRSALRLSVGRSGLRSAIDKSELVAVRYFISGQYFRHPKRLAAGAVMFSFYGGAGVITHYIDYDEILTYYPTGGTYIDRGDTTKTVPALTIGGEMTVFLSSRVGINIGLGANILFAHYTSCCDCIDRTRRFTNYDETVDLRLGLIYVLRQ